MKKIFSILLAVAMLFSLAIPAMAAEDTATVYFQNNWLWTDVYVYIHYTDGNENAAYPGKVMEVSSNDGVYDVYSVEFSVSNIEYIIFSGIKNDGSDSRDATPQIPASDLYRNAIYSMKWDNGNAYSITGGEGGSLDGAPTPTPPSTDDKTINVKGNYVPAQGAGEKISVDVAWEGMEFTYTEGTAGEWLPGQHEYAAGTAGSWSTNKGKITVTNHSNVPVTATLSFATAVDGVIGTFDKNTLDLASAAEGESLGDTDKAPQAAAEFGISGAAITETKDTLGTITVAISGPTVVTTAQELKDAVARGGKIMLGDDIDISSEMFGLDIDTDLTLYLNGKTIMGDRSVFEVLSDGTLTILGDGTLKVNEPDSGSVISVYGGTVNLAGGEIDGNVNVDSGNMNITDGQILGSLAIHNGSCTVGGGQIDFLHVNNGSCTVTGGTFLFIDPTPYVDTTKYTVTQNNEILSYTVTEK